jgi:hypothetical protein
MNLKLYLNYNINYIKNHIINQIDENDIENNVNFNSSILIKDDLDEDQKIWFLVNKIDTNISSLHTLFEKIVVDKSNDKYDILFYEITSPDINKMLYLINYYVDRGQTISKNELIQPYPNSFRCNIVALKKGTYKKYRNIKYKKYFVLSPKTISFTDGNDNEIQKCDILLNENINGFLSYDLNINNYRNNILYEALTQTYPIHNTELMLKKEFPFLKNYFSFVQDQDGQFISINVLNDYIQAIENIEKRMDSYGWFVANQEKHYDNDDNIISISIEFEPKYDIEYNGMRKKQTKFYHITPTIYWENKISKIGLSPKSQSKQSYHPERVYLTYNVDDMESLLKKLFLNNKQDYGYKKYYSILEVDIPNDIKLYVDNGYKGGVFTLNNINVKNVDEIERYLLDTNGNIKERVY